MKRYIIPMMAVAAVIGLGSCSQDTEPRYQPAAEFQLNTPAFATQYYQLSPEGTLQLTCSQPDYGFSAPTEYTVGISLTGDFTDLPEDAEEGTIPAWLPLPTTFDSCIMEISEQEIAAAICELRGISNEADYTDLGYQPLYVRCTARIDRIDDSGSVSNVIKLDNVKGYFAASGPGGPEYIYVPGGGNGWSFVTMLAPDANYEFYTGYAYLKDEFKFTGAPEWSDQAGNWGAVDADGNQLQNGSQTNFKVPAATGNGLYYVSVNYPALTYRATHITKVGLVGGFNGWDAGASIAMTPNDDYTIWTAEANLSDEWKFCMNDGWDLNLGGSADELVQGAGNLPAAGNVTVTLNLSTIPYTCTFTPK